MATLLPNQSLTTEQAAFFNDTMLFLATNGADGQPQVGPKGSLRVLDDQHLVYLEYTYGQAFENVQANPKVAVTGWDVKNHVSLRVNGTVTLHKDDDLAKRLLADSAHPEATVAVIEIDAIYALN
ncbi:MAG: pyridoxamine 5'-phosphate oxidase family protein [Limosilactobacillus sp.]|nr:pyridoxamine 5'-phosphate oxidase family protein [Limosilactobacillus sp.]